jgi:hypothetical protein
VCLLPWTGAYRAVTPEWMASLLIYFVMSQYTVCALLHNASSDNYGSYVLDHSILLSAVKFYMNTMCRCLKSYLKIENKLMYTFFGNLMQS